jgi:hypothetical protein
MAQGNVVASACVSVAAGAVLTIQPPTGVEWMIKNIYYSGQVAFNMTDGTNVIQFDTDGTAGAKLGFSFLLTSSYYMTVQNTGTGAIFIKYEGIQTY